MMVTTRHWKKYPEAIAALLLVVSATSAVLTAVVLEMFIDQDLWNAT